jgi:uncharacterized membrane protein
MAVTGRLKGNTAALIAAAIIMIAVFAIMLAMPKIMALVSWAGPYGGVAVAIAFMLAFFAVFWLRSRVQNRPDAKK